MGAGTGGLWQVLPSPQDQLEAAPPPREQDTQGPGGWQELGGAWTFAGAGSPRSSFPRPQGLLLSDWGAAPGSLGLSLSPQDQGGHIGSVSFSPRPREAAAAARAGATSG